MCIVDEWPIEPLITKSTADFLFCIYSYRLVGLTTRSYDMRDGIVIERTSCCRSSIQRSYTNRPGSPSSDRNRRGIAQRFDRPLLDKVVVEGFVVKHEELHYRCGPGELIVDYPRFQPIKAHISHGGCQFGWPSNLGPHPLKQPMTWTSFVCDLSLPCETIDKAIEESQT